MVPLVEIFLEQGQGSGKKHKLPQKFQLSSKTKNYYKALEQRQIE
jgi:hypothetical protein